MVLLTGLIIICYLHFLAGLFGVIRIRDPAGNRADQRRRTGDARASAAPRDRIRFDAFIRLRGAVDSLGGGCQCVRRLCSYCHGQRAVLAPGGNGAHSAQFADTG